MLAGLQSGLARSGGRPPLTEAERQHLDRLAGSVSPTEQAALWRLRRLAGVPDGEVQSATLQRARRDATDIQLPVPAREASLALLEFGGTPADTTCLLGALAGTEPARVQSAALRVLRSRSDPATGAALVERWRSYAPGVRPEVLQLLLSRRAFHDPLVQALEQQRLTVGELNLDLEQRRRLLRQSTSEIAARAGKFFGDEEYSNRKSLVSDWLTKLPPTGDAARGRGVFEQACAQCHPCAGLGQRVGPDLSGVAHRSVEDLLGNILDPNMAINPGFVTYQAETRDGETQVGLLAVAGAESITLVQAGNHRITIPRSQLVRLESTGSSLMPEGLESGRTPQELRDLIAFLQASR
jgi:putative heme-binding domain-containing protein